MSTDRDIVHPPQLQQLKAATRALIRAFGGQEAAEAATGKSQSQLSNYGAPNAPGFAPVDVVLALEAATHGAPGHPHVGRFLAREAGFALVALPPAGPAGVAWNAHVACLVKEIGELLAGLGEALASGNDVRAREARALLGDAGDVVRVAVEIEAALKARAGEVG